MVQQELLCMSKELLVAEVVRLREVTSKCGGDMAHLKEQWRLHSEKAEQLKQLYLQVLDERDNLQREVSELRQKSDRTSVFLDLTERARNSLEKMNRDLCRRVASLEMMKGAPEDPQEKTFEVSVSVTEEDDEGALPSHQAKEGSKDSEKDALERAVSDMRAAVEKRDLDISFLKGVILRLKDRLKSYEALKGALEKRVAIMEEASSGHIAALQNLQAEYNDAQIQLSKAKMNNSSLREETKLMSQLREECEVSKECLSMQAEEILTMRHMFTNTSLEYSNERNRLLQQLNSPRPEDSRRIRELQFDVIAANGHRNHWESKVSNASFFLVIFLWHDKAKALGVELKMRLLSNQRVLSAMGKLHLRLEEVILSDSIPKH